MKSTFIVVLILGAAAGTGFVALKANAVQATTPENKASTPWAEQVAANGVVEGARPEIALRPEITGTLAVVHVRENQDVTKGMLLAELSNDTQKEQVALARAEVAVAKAQLDRLRNGEQLEKRQALAAQEDAKRAVYEQAKSDFERWRRLAGTRSDTQERFEGDQAKLQRAKAELAQAQAERALIEAPARADEMAAAEAHVAATEARLRLAQAELAKTRLLAPRSGRILQVYAEPGEMAGPTSTQPILLLADLSLRRVRAFIEELDATRVRVGQQAVVTADGLPGKEFAGRVAVVLPRMGKRSLQSDSPGEYKDLYFREVLIDLDKGDELPLNLRVQTRFDMNSSKDVR